MQLEVKKKVILGQESFIVENDQIRLALTEMGGNMAPVYFYKDSADPIQPYYFSPWQRERLPLEHTYMDVFRGDLFCFPFGYSAPECPFHGETGAYKWTLDSCEREGNRNSIALHLDLISPGGRVDKEISLVDGHNTLYITHTISGAEGQYSFAHHATLDVNPERDAYISLSPVKFGVAGTSDGSVFNPREHGYPFMGKTQEIGPDMRMSTIWKDPDTVDVSHVPIIENFSGAMHFYHKDIPNTPSWTCLWFPKQNFVWYDMKNVKKQQGTLFWLEFGGRYQYPWNGRTMCIAVEDMGVVPMRHYASAMTDLMNKYGVEFSKPFTKDEPFTVHHIQGVAKVCENFGKVKDIRFTEGGMTLISENGFEQYEPIDWQFCLK